jgi:LysR family transcriptional regulator, regulator for genes of the gallate degradation pathway
VVARKGHPLTALKTLSLRDLLRHDWIMPGSSTPRQQALERLFVGMAEQPRVSIETTSMQIYRAILASTDRLTLMSRAESQLNDNSALTVLPFRSPHLRRVDGVATRADWQPTSIHRQFLDLLRVQARASTGIASNRPDRARRASGRRPARRKLPRKTKPSARIRVR